MDECYHELVMKALQDMQNLLEPSKVKQVLVGLSDPMIFVNLLGLSRFLI